MTNEYRDGLKAIDRERGRTGWTLFKVLLTLMFVGAGLSAVGYTLGWFKDAGQVVREEFGPKAALHKYEWFKDAGAQLDKKKADIGVYETRMTQLRSDYGDAPRSEWDRTDKEQMNQWSVEVAGVTASYNSLAAEWNSQISKFNWQVFQGDLPEGASDLLSRDFAPYQSN